MTSGMFFFSYDEAYETYLEKDKKIMDLLDILNAYALL